MRALSRYQCCSLSTETPVHLGHIVGCADAPDPKPSEIPAVDKPKLASPPTEEERAAVIIAQRAATLARGASMIVKCPSVFTETIFRNALMKHSARFFVTRVDPTHFLIKAW